MWVSYHGIEIYSLILCGQGWFGLFTNFRKFINPRLMTCCEGSIRREAAVESQSIALADLVKNNLHESSLSLWMVNWWSVICENITVVSAIAETLWAFELFFKNHNQLQILLRNDLCDPGSLVAYHWWQAFWAKFSFLPLSPFSPFPASHSKNMKVSLPLGHIRVKCDTRFIQDFIHLPSSKMWYQIHSRFHSPSLEYSVKLNSFKISGL